MSRRSLFCLPVTPLLIWIHFVAGQTSSANWQFPVLVNQGLTINYIDTVVLAWTSNYEEAWINIWCQKNGSIGNNVVLGSQFQVQPSGNLPYIMFTDDPDQAEFPVACHAQLAVQPNGSGVDSPVGVTFTSQPNVKAQTFSLSSNSAPSAALTMVSAAPLTTITSASSLTTDVSSSAVTSTISSGSVPILNNTPIHNSTAPHGPEGLSNGAKAGVGLGSAAIALGGFGVLIWSLMWHRRKATEGPQEVKDSEKGDSMHTRYGKYELEDGANRRHELEGGRPRVHELVDNSCRRYELP